uniref:Amidase domain-containing protein n=1 Tax=Trichuris muris TaxID=70415 RepID=A0A5S6Q9A7_TRIMR
MAHGRITIPLITYVSSQSTLKARFLRIVSQLWFHLIQRLFAIIFYFFPRACLPDTNDNLLFYSAVNLAKSIRSGTTTSETVVKTYIKRIKQVNHLINAVVRDRFDDALEEARLIDRLVVAGSAPTEDEKPFLGVPFTMKDAFIMKGMITTAGMATRRDAEVTNVSESCMWWECYNTIYGMTKNPHDLRRTCGGSSGGEGALIAAAGSIIGIATDIGGSIRIPASFCGIFGHKPSSGIVSNVGCYPPLREFRDEMHSVGPMCRRAEDLAPMLFCMANREHRDKLLLFTPVDLKNLNIYYFEEIVSPAIAPVQDDVRRAVWRVISHFEVKRNSVCVKVDFSLFHLAFCLWQNDMNSSNTLFRKTITDAEYEVNVPVEICRILLGLGRHTIPGLGAILFEETMNQFLCKEPHKWRTLRSQLKRQVEHILRDDGVLIMPVHPTVAPYHYSPLLMPFNFAYTALFNSLGLPVTVCPVGVNRDRMPICVQVVAAEGQDRLTLAVARELEHAFSGCIYPK